MHSKVFLRMKTLWTWLCLLAARLWGHTRWCSAPAARTSNNSSEVSLPQYYIIPYYTIFDNFSRPPNKCDKINVKKVFYMCLSVLNFICVNMSCTFVLVCVVGITSLLLSALEDRFLLFALLYIYFFYISYLVFCFIVKLREREGQRVDLGRSLKCHL